MEKIFDIFLAVLLALFLAKTIPVLACSNGSEIVTGAACSIKDLNDASEGRVFVDKPDIQKNFVKDLRPVRMQAPEKKDYKVNCPFGSCLYKTVLKIY